MVALETKYHLTCITDFYDRHRSKCPQNEHADHYAMEGIVFVCMFLGTTEDTMEQWLPRLLARLRIGVATPRGTSSSSSSRFGHGVVVAVAKVVARPVQCVLQRGRLISTPVRCSCLSSAIPTYLHLLLFIPLL